MTKQKWSYDGVDLCTKAWSVIEVAQGIGTPGFRGGNIQVPFQNGKRWIKKRYEERVIMLPMWIRGVDHITGKVPDGHTEKEKLFDNIDYLTKLFGHRGQYILKRTLPDGSIRQAQAEVYSPINFVKKLPRYAMFAVEFLLSDPFFYSLEKVEDTKIVEGTTTSWVHNNLGTAPVTKAVVTLTGPLESPKIECVDSGVWLQYMGSIGSGETVVINTEDFTCEKGGMNMISAIKHGGDAYWLVIDSGDSQMKVICSIASSGSVKIEYYPAYF